MVRNFSVDVWLLFGSFCYGAEGRIVRFSERSLDVSLVAATPDDSSAMGEFFESIISNPKGLLKSELRIYCDMPAPDASLMNGVHFPVSLFTDVCPVALLHDEEDPRLIFSHLCGISNADEFAWQQLVRKIWLSAES